MGAFDATWVCGKGVNSVLYPCHFVTAMLAVLFGVKKPVTVAGEDEEECGDVLHQRREEEAG